MQLGVIGLGRMGGNIVRRLTQRRPRVRRLRPEPGGHQGAGGQGRRPAAPTSSNSSVSSRSRARSGSCCRPARSPRTTVEQLGALLEPGDVIIDGGNSFYKDDIRRAKALKAKGIHYVDCGTSGGVWGLERGYCLMIGGDKERSSIASIRSSARWRPGRRHTAITPDREGRDPRVERGYMHCGPSGAGRFVKMVHNGIEYGLMQAYAEGFNILRGASSDELPEDQRFQLDLPDIAEVWRRGSVIGSWLLDLTAMALAEDPKLVAIIPVSSRIPAKGAGRSMPPIEEAVPADVLSAALYARFRSREEDSFSDKVLSAMRNKFGGHVEPKAAG